MTKPFKNGDEFSSWLNENCYLCVKFAGECKFAMALYAATYNRGDVSAHACNIIWGDSRDFTSRCLMLDPWEDALD